MIFDINSKFSKTYENIIPPIDEIMYFNFRMIFSVFFFSNVENRDDDFIIAHLLIIDLTTHVDYSPFENITAHLVSFGLIVHRVIGSP